MGGVVILLIAMILVQLFIIVIYNQLVRLQNMVAEAWSGIDVQLKKRANLIPNLVEVVKGYIGHERELLEKVTALRSESLNATGLTEKSRVEAALGRSLTRVLLVAEHYPDLKASQSFLDLQEQLVQSENDIEMARRYYNGTVRNLNIRVESIPCNIVARMFRFTTADFFEIKDEEDRHPQRVQL